DVQAGGLEFFDFLEQRLRRQHDAVADEAGDARVHDARGDQSQDGLLAVDPKRMAGVVTALEAHHALDGLSQPVDDLALAFVTPLGADNRYVLAHCTNQYRVSREYRKSPCGPPVGGMESVLQRPERPGAVLQREFAVSDEFIQALLVARQ